MSGPPRQPHALVVAYDFPPHAAIGTMRTLRVIRQLDARGWQLTVLTGDPSTYLPSTPVDLALLRQVPPRVRVIRARAFRPWNRLQDLAQRAVGGQRQQRQQPPPQQRNGAAAGTPRRGRTMHKRPWPVEAIARVQDIVDAALSIPDRETGWLAPAVLAGVFDDGDRRPDVIYSSAPPWTGQLVAAAVARALRRPWVADFRDPWGRAPWREDRYRFAMRAAGRLERFVVSRCDRLVFVAAGNRDEFARHYGEATAAKFEVVPNGCDPSEFDAIGTQPVDAAGSFVLLHAGSLYAGRRSPRPLFDAVATAIDRGLIDSRRFRLRFLGAEAPPDLRLAPALAPIVEFLPRVPREQSLRAMMAASALLLLQPGHTVSVPGKVYEYLAAGRPILAIAEEGEISSLIRRAGAGVSIVPGDAAAIVDALALLTGGGCPQPSIRREHYDGTIGAARIADLIDAVARPSSILTVECANDACQ